MPSSEQLLAEQIARQQLRGVEAVSFIDAGFSRDRKYRIETDAKPYLLRVSDLEEVEQRRLEFETLGKLHERGVRCTEPVGDGIQVLADDDICYGLYSYIPGECGTTELPKLTLSQQHQIGLDAGVQLRMIHQALPSRGSVDECEIRGGKYRKYRDMLAEKGVTYRGQSEAGHFVEANLDLLKNRPSTLRHGDFHPGNLIIREGKLAGVIDFNRCDWGDPYDDFYKTAYFGAPVSPAYARGLVIGYFDGEPLEEFWPIYNVYVAAVLPADIAWAMLLFPHQVPDAIQRVEHITATHDFRSGGPPDWWF